MASYYMLCPVYSSHLLCASPSSQDRTCCRGLCRRRNSRHLSLLRCKRNWGLWADFSSRWGKLAASSTSSTVLVVVAFDNYPGRVDTAVDAGTMVSDSDFFPDILDARYRSNGRTAPPSLPYSNSSACNGPGPSDLDFEIYASNSIEDFEPPPPPRIPFGGPFEDYYGEIVGEDYIPKQEKPTSSLLEFLDSLNAKRAEEEANAEKNPEKPLFSQSRRVPSARENKPLFPDNRPLFSQSQLVEQPATIQPIAEEEPLLPQTRPVQGAAGDTSGSTSLLPQNSNVQGTTDASRPLIPQNIPIDVTPSFPQTRLSEVSIEQSVLSSQTRSVEESKEQKTLFSSPTNTLEQTSSSSRSLFPQTRTVEREQTSSSSRPLFPQTRTVEDSRDPLSPITRTTDVIRDSGMPLSPQTRMVEQPRGSSIKDSRRPFSTLTGVTEELRDSDRPLSPQLRTPEETMDNRPLSPQLRTTEETTSNRPLSPSMRPFEETRDTSRSRSAEEIKDSSRPLTLETRHEEEFRESSLPLIPQNRPMDETMDSNGPSFSQSRPVEEIRDGRRPVEDFTENRPLISQSTPFEEIRDVRPLIPQTRHMEETRPLASQTRSVEERRDISLSISSQARSLEETSGVSRSVFPQTRPVETTSVDRISFAQTRPVEETLDISRPLFSQSRPLEENKDRSRPLFPQSRPMDINRDEIRSLYPQTRPAERTVDNKPLFSGNGETIPQKNAWTIDSSELHVDQMNGVMVAEPGSPTLTSPATVMNAPDGFADVVSKSQFYEPREGDIILGAVTFANDQELDLEIGAELPALMPLRDFQPFPQIVDNIFFKLPPTDGSSQTLEGFVAPHGRSLLVEDKAAGDGSYHDEMVDIGTIVIAEVQGRAVTDGRAVLSRRLPAQRLAWHRIEQLMRFGEEIQLEIVQYNEGGLLGYLEGVRAFLPRSELLQRPESTAVLNNYVGRTLSVAVVQADKQASNIIISEVKLWMSKNLQLGTVHDVTVTRIYPYGMQVEVDNTRIRGFVHISNFSQEYVSSVTSIFAEGDKARAMLIKGRNPGQVSFSIADLERDRGLLLRDKEQVFQDAEETARSFREGLSEQERKIFGLPASETRLDFQDLGIANLNWLHVGNVINSSLSMGG